MAEAPPQRTDANRLVDAALRAADLLRLSRLKPEDAAVQALSADDPDVFDAIASTHRWNTAKIEELTKKAFYQQVKQESGKSWREFLQGWQKGNAPSEPKSEDQ